MPHFLFDPNLDGQYQTTRAYTLATLLRSMEYPDGDYVEAWKNVTGCGAYWYNNAGDGFPMPYFIGYHPDGVIMAFAGLRNMRQALTYYQQSSVAPYFRCPGNVMHFARICYEGIRAELEAKFDAAPNKTRLILCGHSAGGTLAAIAFHHFKAIAGATVPKYVYTFGTPRPGDSAFCEPLRGHCYAVENEGDFVPAYPYFTRNTIPFTQITTSVHLPVNAGQPLYLYETGLGRFERPWLREPALPRLILNLINDPAGPSGVAHSTDTYAQRLGLAMDREAGDWGGRSAYYPINYAINNGWKYSDKLVAVLAADHTPVAAPDLPTVPQVQSRPTDDGNPATPAPTPPDTSLVGVTHRVYAEATVSSSLVPMSNYVWRGKDRRLIERYQYAVGLMLRRDTLLGRKRPSRELSTLQPFFDSDDTDLFFDVMDLDEYLQELLRSQYTGVPTQPVFLS